MCGKKHILGLAAVVALGMTLTGYAHVYVEGYGGGVFGRAKHSRVQIDNIFDQAGLTACLCLPTMNLSGAFVGGVKIGLWGSECGWLSDCAPCWLEHLGFYVDLSGQKLDCCNAWCAQKISYYLDDGPHTGGAPITFNAAGSALTLAFMAACRACFCRTDECPQGQYQLYLGIGPAVLFARQKTRLVIGPHEINDPHFSLVLKNAYTIAPCKTDSRHKACCQLTAGVRQLNCSCFLWDGFFTYRYAPVSFAFTAPQGTEQDRLSTKQYGHLFGFQLGLGYQF